MKNLVRGEDGLWRDEEGTIIALPEKTSSVDDKVRCGVGVASLPEDHWATDACRPHDYKTSSPAYQAFHNRSEAEDDFDRDLGILAERSWGRRIVAVALSTISRLSSWDFWENKKTRWK